jgi:hypothetical protein
MNMNIYCKNNAFRRSTCFHFQPCCRDDRNGIENKPTKTYVESPRKNNFKRDNRFKRAKRVRTEAEDDEDIARLLEDCLEAQFKDGSSCNVRVKLKYCLKALFEDG